MGSGDLEDVGAVTFADGTVPLIGEISVANSTHWYAGRRSSRQRRQHALTNGNYVIRNSRWSNGSAREAGAATFADGTTGITGEVSERNSLVGTNSGDYVGHYVAALSNGNYVVGSRVGVLATV